jgi:hypothetical protein
MMNTLDFYAFLGAPKSLPVDWQIDFVLPKGTRRLKSRRGIRLTVNPCGETPPPPCCLLAFPLRDERKHADFGKLPAALSTF